MIYFAIIAIAEKPRNSFKRYCLVLVRWIYETPLANTVNIANIAVTDNQHPFRKTNIQEADCQKSNKDGGGELP